MSGDRVAVVGDAAPALAPAVEAAGGRPDIGGDRDLGDGHRAVVAAGEAALVDLARRDVDPPVLPVDAGQGVRSVAREDVAAALGRVLEGTYDTDAHPVVSATSAGTEGDADTGTDAGHGVSALFDVALMAAEPARISEFAVRCRGELVGRFRADGVVASTPAGSPGYNRAADGSVVAPETGVVAVVPVAPFATDADDWVLPVDEVTLSVERDETPVELLADGRTERTVAADDSVSLSRAGAVRTVVVPESGPFF